MVVVSIIIVIVKLLNVDSWDVLHVSYDISHYKTSSSAAVCSLVKAQQSTTWDGLSERPNVAASTSLSLRSYWQE